MASDEMVFVHATWPRGNCLKPLITTATVGCCRTSRVCTRSRMLPLSFDSTCPYAAADMSAAMIDCAPAVRALLQDRADYIMSLQSRHGACLRPEGVLNAPRQRARHRRTQCGMFSRCSPGEPRSFASRFLVLVSKLVRSCWGAVRMLFVVTMSTCPTLPSPLALCTGGDDG